MNTAMMQNLTRHEYFMEHALKCAEDALSAGEFPVGCVIERGGEIISSGAREGTMKEGCGELDHAEITALKNISVSSRREYLGDAALYCTMEPCLMCYGAIMISGIKKIIYAYEDPMGGGTDCAISAMKPLYSSAEVKIVPGVLRERSLELFRKFFMNPENTYWKRSLLEHYTLEQKKVSEFDRKGIRE